jgi:recombination protein RecT
MGTVRDGAEQVSNAVAIYTQVKDYRDSFAAVLPTHMRDTADTYVRLASSLIRSDRRLAQVAQQNPQSALRALLKGASYGLVPGETFDLIAFGGKNPAVVGVVRYTGVIDLMHRAGAITAVKAEIIHERDTFQFEPAWAHPIHRVDWFSDRGPMIGAYAYAEMKGGGTSRVVVMNRAEIEKIRDGSPGWRYEDQRKNSPWTLWPDRMWLKTVVHQLRKWVPTSTEYITAQVEAAERGRARAAADGLTEGVSPLENEDPDLTQDGTMEAEVESETEWTPDPDVGANDPTTDQ